MRLLIAVLVLATLAACGGGGSGSSAKPKASASPEPTAMEAAYLTCADQKVGNPLGKKVPASSVITGDATSLVVDGAGDQFKSAPAALCLLTALKADAATISQVQSTTALMGRQTAAWGDYTATWSFHPDNGMDMTIQMAS